MTITSSKSSIEETIEIVEIPLKSSICKFRAWDEIKKIMHYDFQFISSGDGKNDWIVFTSDKQKLYDYPNPLDNPYPRLNFKITEEVRENVYVGDFIEAVDTEINRRVIGEVIKRNDEYFFGVGSLLFDELKLSTIKVKGNIFETPEMSI